MTAKEHALLIGIIAAQIEALHSLMDVLKSRGIIDEDDLHAFSQIRQPETHRETMKRAEQIYSLIAKTVGIDPEADRLLPSR
jgi:hypothetical protein